MHLWVNQHGREETLPKVSHGKGCEVFDVHGKRYLDGSGGPALFSLGYSNEYVTAAIKEQIDKIQFGYTTVFSSDPIDGLAETIAKRFGADLTYTSFVSGGSEAVETCLKIALQYHVARGEPGRTTFIARRQSWHGYTLGALGVSGHHARRAPYENALRHTGFVSLPNTYRMPAGVEAADLVSYCARELESEILRIGPGKVAGFIFEPVAGAAAGAVCAPDGYARAMREVCDRYGVLMIADEVMCGVGRCGTWRALDHDGVTPDIMAVAKGLGGGYVPLGAAVYTERVYAQILEQFPTVASIHTYSGHTLACAAGLAVMETISQNRLVERCASAGRYLRASLDERLSQHEHVGDIRGRGLLLSVEIVQDKVDKSPFPAERGIAGRVRRNALARGLICYPCAGTVNGLQGDHVLLSPPYIVSEAEMDEIVHLLAESLDAAIEEGLVA